MENLFLPIYKKIETEFIELSYSIYINRSQLKTYSVKIADLILRTVSECENLAVELCKKEKIKFKNKNGRIRTSVYFPEYIEALNDKYNLKQKYVGFDYQNSDKNVYDFKLTPFRKKEIKSNKTIKENWSWYHAYNKMKHDRNKFFKLANLDNLINAMAALFLLNNYLLDKTFYSKDVFDRDIIMKEIWEMSDVFKLEIAPDVVQPEDLELEFPNPFEFAKMALPYSTYLMKFDEYCETDSDKGKYFGDIMKSAMYYEDESGEMIPAHPDLKLKRYETKCAVVVVLNKKY